MKQATRTLAIILFFAAIPALAATKIFESFEGDGFGSWDEQGNAFGKAPVPGITKGLSEELTGYSGESLACSAHGGDAATGSLTSSEFTIEENYIVFLIAGGNQPGKACVQLWIDGKVVLEATGKNSYQCASVKWDVSAWIGKKASIRLVDEATGKWGFIAADHFLFTDYSNQKFPPVTRGNKPYVKGLVAAPNLAGVTIPAGVTATVIADHKEQKVTSPTALCFDEKGNIYISETHRFRFGVEDDRNHLYWYLDDLAAQTTADRRKLHEKWKAKKSIEKMTEKSEIVRVLSDQDGDGVFETSKVFADGFNDVLDGTAAGVFAFEGTVYFASIPSIWSLRDNNGDGISDEKKIVQDGFGVRISLSGHDLNGFALGPDGMIYGTVGDRGLSFMTKEGKTYHYPNEGAAFRFEPDGSHFELVHTGLRNPKEIAFDAQGNAISVDNNSDQGDKARIVFIVPGADSGWQMEHQAMHTFSKQIGLEKHPVNRWMAERMWEPQNDEQPAFIVPAVANLTSGPSGLTYHPGAGFLESEAGRFLICDYRGASAASGIFSFAVGTDGAGMKLLDAREFNWGVAATDVEYSYDGKLVVADFKGGWTSHQDGRLYSLDAGKNTYLADAAMQTSKWFAEGFDKQTTADLSGMLSHPDMRVRLRAQIELTRRAEGLAELKKAISSDKVLARLHGVWGVGIIARRGSASSTRPNVASFASDTARMSEATQILVNLLKDEDKEIRAQALRMLCDVKQIDASALPIGDLLKDDSKRVVFYAALFAAKHGVKSAIPPVLTMLKSNQDQDAYLRHAGSYALASLLSEQQFREMSSEKDASIKLATVVALRRLKSPLLEGYVKDANPRVADEAIRAIHDLMLESSRPVVASLLDDLEARERTEMMWRRLLHSAFRLGGEANAKRLLKAACDLNLSDSVREEAIRLLSIWPKPFPVEQAIGFWAPLPERSADEIKPLLSDGLPTLIRTGGQVLAKSLGLVEQYELTLDDLTSKDLAQIVENPSLSGAARAKGLELFVRAKPSDLKQKLEAWAGDTDATLAIAALGILLERYSDTGVALLMTSLRSENHALAQGAWTLLAKVPGEQASSALIKGLQDLQAAKGRLPYAIELLEAAEFRTEPEVKKALEQWKSSLPAGDLLAAWMTAVDGGDAKRGEQIYLSHPAECMRCHRAGERHQAGGDAGPNLGGVANRGDHVFLMESMIVPGAVVAPGFGVVSVTLHNDQSVAGIMLKETKDYIDIDAGDSISRVKRADIKEMTPPISAMPPMFGLLKPREARDLVAWLATLTKPVPQKKAQKKVVPVLISQQNSESSEAATEKQQPEAVVPTAAAGDAKPSAEAMALGKTQYAACLACHGADGGGAPSVGPPLAGSEWVTGPAENLIRIQLRGLMGPIQVKGSEYNLVMPPQAHQSDDQIAAVLTYIRNSFGNQASAVSAEQVAALRSEVGKPMLTAAELIPPVVAKAAAAEGDVGEKTVVTKPQISLSTRLGVPLWVAGLALLWIGLCVRVALKDRGNAA